MVVTSKQKSVIICSGGMAKLKLRGGGGGGWFDHDLAVVILLSMLVGVLGNASLGGGHEYGDHANIVPEAAASSSIFNRSSFPDSFFFGAASSAYQYEGAARKGGKGPSIWDTFVHQHPEKIADHSTGDVAVDFYHRYKEDINMIQEVGLNSFRFSISWPRILPRGKISGGINREGIDFYNSIINELLSKGIKPFVTLFHWDVPQTLEDEYGGFLNVNIVNDYRDYANLCFKEFGDRVKHWITFNEPLIFTMFGYETGTQAPGRCSSYAGNCAEGNSATEPYIVVHNQLLSHGATVKLYREKYKKSQKGEIGITLASQWYEPLTSSVLDLKATQRVLDFQLGWLLHPITYGDYPPVMRSYVGNRLPTFTKKQSKMLKGSQDFFGFNYYTSNYVSHALYPNTINATYTSDSHANITTFRNGAPICEPTSLYWLFICPKGIKELMLYVKNKYNDPAIYITENGMAEQDDGTMSVPEALVDNQRIRYYQGHLWYLQEAIKDGANVKGHFAWSFFDDFEWGSGYTLRFGISFIDYKNGLKRYPKHSAIWYKRFLKGDTN